MENKKKSKKKMKKILFISTRDPYSGRYSGDVIGSKKIINILKKKNVLDVVCLGEKNFSQKNIFKFKQPFFLSKIFYVFKSLILFQPLQFGLFFSKKHTISKLFFFFKTFIILFEPITSPEYLPEYGSLVEIKRIFFI